MEEAANGGVNSSNADTAATSNGTDSKAETKIMRDSLPALAVRRKETTAAPPDIRSGARAVTAAAAVAEPPAEDGGSDGGRKAAGGVPSCIGGVGVGGAGGGTSGGGGVDSGSRVAQAGPNGDEAAGRGIEPDPSSRKLAEDHLSRTYTKEELMARHWGMNLSQMKRVKALLTMGVCEEDLVMADRLLKLGRDWSDDIPPTKEEQLLGYTAQQRQRMKALHILGLTEESIDRCRAVMLSSLGPSAFGFSADETAASVAMAEAEEGWTPGEKFRRKAPGHLGGGGGGGDGGGIGGGLHHNGILRMPTFGPSGHAHMRKLGSSSPFAANGGGGSDVAGGGIAGFGVRVRQQMRRVSDSDTGGYQLPDINAGKRKPRGAGGAVVAVGQRPLETIVGSPILSTKTDPG